MITSEEAAQRLGLRPRARFHAFAHGLQTMCEGVGMANATIIERL